MEACLKHLQGFDKSLCDLANSNKDSHRRIDKRSKEVEGLNVMKFVPLDSFLVFTFSSSPSGLIILILFLMDYLFFFLSLFAY